MIPSTKTFKPFQSPRTGESDKGTAAEPKNGPQVESRRDGSSEPQKSVKDYLREAEVQRDA